MKKYLFLSLAMLISLSGVAKDFSYTYEGQTIYYTIVSEDDKTCKTKNGTYNKNRLPLLSGNHVSGIVTIPDIAYDGDVPYTVIGIGDLSFWQNAITELNIPNTVTSIEKYAFRTCRSLKSIILPPSVTDVANLAFDFIDVLIRSAYPNILNNPFHSGICIAYPVEDVIIEDGFVYGPEKSKIYFAPLNLEGDYSLPENVTEITDNAFAHCDNLAAVTLHSDLKKIGDNAFANCKNLTDITLNPDFENFGESVWTGCSAIEKVTCKSTEPVLGSDNVFEQSVYDNAYLEIPKGTMGKYKATSPWKNFRYSGYHEDLDLDMSLSHSSINIDYLDNGQVVVDILGHKVGTHNLTVTLTDCDGKTKTENCEILVSDVVSLINKINADKNNTIGDIYNINGVLIKKNPTSKDVQALNPGFYVIGDKKVLIRK